MITHDKIERAIAKIKSQQEKSKLRKNAAIIAEVKENISQNPYELGAEIRKVAAIYKDAPEEKQMFLDEVLGMLEQAIEEHVHILLSDAIELAADKTEDKETAADEPE